MGASVTACGRAITTHMMSEIGRRVTGTPAKIERRYVHYDKKVGNSHDYAKASNIYSSEGAWKAFLSMPLTRHTSGLMGIYGCNHPAIIYGDTDSCYFTTNATDREDAVKKADKIAADTNATFPDFMRKAFNCQPTFDDLIKAGREVVAERGLFQAKKKYILKVVDLEGMQVDKLKSQGSEIKKADTPKVIQEFLKDLMTKVLSGERYEELERFVNEKRKEVVGREADIFSIGVAKQVNNLDALYAEYTRVEKKGGKVNLPGHIRAAINYNEIVQLHEEGPKLVRSGDKAKVFYLKPNQHGVKSIAFPADFDAFPSWFADEFQVDRALTEEKMFDTKLKYIFESIGWEVPTPQKALIKRILKF
jgi:DNA polymerase elongation subunit (family B)